MFLTPYLFFYLLYAWLKWPVDLGSDSSPQHLSLRSVDLLHVFWVLHAVHILLATFALVTYWHKASINPAIGSVGDGFRSSFTWSVLPWGLLALCFWIPGVYLEFPADPWEHYARINDWSHHLVVTNNPVWTKFSYFFAYSFIGRIHLPLQQLRYFDLYYTGCCVMLCWQYYRLGQAVGLRKRAAFIFVLIQAFTLGNNIFGFYRYYGMSSSLFAQLGAITLIRIGLEILKAPVGQITDTPFQRSFCKNHNNWLLLVPACGCLLVLIGLNHIQGLGIAALGLVAVLIWRLVVWRTIMAAWIVCGTVLLSLATVLWLPRHDALDASLRPAGWLTSWYGFNLVDYSSPAFDRAWVILGVFGALNLGAGLILLRRNHVAGWLTVVPWLALCLPMIAVPFANATSQKELWYILTFHRFLFAIPPGLAGMVIFERLIDCRTRERNPVFPDRLAWYSSLPLWSILPLAMAILVLLPAQGPTFNRFWQSIMRPPNDLTMRHVLANSALKPNRQFQNQPSSVPYAVSGVGFVSQAAGGAKGMDQYRLINLPVILYTANLIDAIENSARKGTNASLLLPDATALYSTYSQNAFLSRHWLPLEVAMEHAGHSELRAQMDRLHWQETRGYRAGLFQAVSSSEETAKVPASRDE